MSCAKPVVRLLGGVALSVALSLHQRPVYGQDAAGTGEAPPPGSQPAASSDADATTIVVTGTRITSSGFTAPTPTTMVTSEDLLKSAQPNLFSAVTQLPSLLGSTGVTTGTNSTSSGTQGLSSFALRGLGTIRTLTLLDGQRVVGANVTGVPDISQFPQLLIKRVDVVTGGASASYGSDAVGGVVNFITDKRFEGFKAQAQGGITTYGDNGQYLLGVAAGRAFLDNRLHLEGSVEYDHENGVPPGGLGEDAPGDRDWFHADTLANTGNLNNGFPQYNYISHAQAYQYAKYGLITNGPLQGTAFDAAGNPFPFVYGSNGVPAKNAAGTVIGCYVGFCVGGDNSGAVGIGTTLQSSVERTVGFGRIGFELNDTNEVYATVTWANVETANQPNPGSAKQGLTIQCSNPFVPAATQQACADAGITSFQYGVVNAFLPNILVEPEREQHRFVLGAEGQVNAFGTDWHYDSYYERGENTTDIHVSNMPLNPRYNQAIQAISLNGQTVCANDVARANGCVPLNIFGNVTPSPDALAYTVPVNGPFQHTRQTQDAASIAINGDPFSLWAGPVSFAFGGEWRREAYRVVADPYGNGVTAESPNSSAYPADPILNPAGNNWYAGNYHNGSGAYHVTEAFLETNLPFLDSASFGKANLNLAGRWTDYSTSGTVYTWKIGGTWRTPYQPLRLRAVFSRDVRAPNLSELFAAPVSINVPGFFDPFHNTNVTITQNTIGNTNLKPESARNLEVGLVLTQPDFLPGFSASVDFYRIRIRDGISSLTARNQVDLCFQGVQQYCSTFFLAPAPAQSFVNVQVFNLASIYTKGVDIEASYQMRLANAGALTFRALATHVIDNTSNSGAPGTVPVQNAGVNTGSTPDWKLFATQSWDYRSLGLDLTERWISDGVFGHQYIVCQSNCPPSTAANPTIDRNHMAGAFYVDLGARYSVNDKLKAFIKVDNVFDRDPVPAPQTNTGIDINPLLYDTLGRTYRAGLRYNF
ncbi:MAG TPA: TonB-dependent receptor [Steroidobacteraceae bacterium]|nr:TonB-dependent receptor [Steroidobacteraceae bacterium]